MKSEVSLLRRLAAAFYDGLLLIGLLFVAAAIVIIPAGGAPSSTLGLTLFRVYLIAVAFLFFGGFWTHGGQTLGMRAWRIRVLRRDSGAPLDWPRAALRFLAAVFSWLCAGAGYLWALIDRDRLTWHDRLSGTYLVLLSKR